MIKRWLWFLLAVVLAIANPVWGESRTGTVSGDEAHVTVFFLKGQDYSYTLSAQPTGGWVFTSAFSFPGGNGWYKSGTYSASCEQLAGYTTAFIDAATAFSATISGSMYKPGPGPGSPIPWSVTGENGSGAALYYWLTPLTAVLPVGGAEKETFYYYFSLTTPALSGCWKIASVTTGGGEWIFYQGNSMSFPPSANYAPGEYIITAARNTRGDRAKSTGPVRLVGVQKVEAIYSQPSEESPGESIETNVTSTTATPGAEQTIYIPIGESVTITASPDPAGAWPDGYPKWKVGNNEQTASAGNAAFSFSSNTPGEYTVSAQCGTGTYSTKALKVVVIRLKLKYIDFLGTGNHRVRKGTMVTPWESDRFDDNGQIPITYDEWQDEGLDGTPEINDPVCYTKGLKPQMKATFTIEPELSNSITADLQVMVGTVPTTATIALSGSKVTISGLSWSSALPNYVTNANYTLSWSFSLNDGNSYCDISSSTTKFFIVYATPAGTAVTAKRLAWSTLKANGESNTQLIADKIWNGVASETNFSIIYNVDGWTLLDEKANGWGGDCDNQARCMTYAMQQLGISAEVKLVYASTDAGAGNCLTMESKVENGETWYLILDFVTTGSEHNWNQYEGCSNTADYYYAITPKRKASNDYTMLTSLSCRQYRATISTNATGAWSVVAYQGPIAIP